VFWAAIFPEKKSPQNAERSRKRFIKAVLKNGGRRTGLCLENPLSGKSFL
jgi:ribosomal protein L25 (general stress protein Ctc)